MTNFKQQLNLISIALVFLTRIPLTSSINFSQKNLNQASRYFPLIGWLIGLICALIFVISNVVLPSDISILFSMLVGVFITGCFHEDGLADTCDGLGGGWEKQQKLDIMKDSRIGAYGAISLWFVFTIKLMLLTSLVDISISALLIAIIIAHPLSRAVSTAMIYFLPYVGNAESSKVKPFADSLEKRDLIVSSFIGLSSLLLVSDAAMWIVLSLLFFLWVIRKFLNSQIQGITGDTLGAVQQISEIIIYLVLLVASTNESSLSGSNL